DNALPTSVGSTFRAYRASTGNVAVSSGLHPLPANFFDSLERVTDDLQWNNSNGTLQVSLEGTYMVNLRYKINSIPGNSKLDSALYLAPGGGGTPGFIRIGGGEWADSYAANSSDGVHSSNLVYLKPNDLLQIGYWAGGNYNNALTGDAGLSTYVEVALVNWNRSAAAA